MEKQFELNEKQTKLLLDLTKPKKSDIFYDLGCGKGRIIRESVIYGKVKLAVGIETDIEFYDHARKLAITNLDKCNLKKVDFWLGRFDSEDTVENRYVFDLKEATIIYNSLEEEKDDLDFYKKRVNWKKIKLIKKDLPLVGYQSMANRKNNDCWFFLMKSPIKRITSLKKWVKTVHPDFNDIDEVYQYYRTQLENRFKKLGLTKKESIKDANASVRDLRKLVCLRFCQI